MNEKPLIYFVKLARFSNTNGHVEAQLRRVFPEFDVEVIDLADFFRRPSLLLAFAVANALPRLCWDFLRRRLNRRDAATMLLQMVQRNPLIFRALGARARKQMAQQPRPIRFTLQTQGLWNSTMPHVPSFMYTDSAAKTNLMYKVVDKRLLPPQKWLELEAELNHSVDRVFVMSNHVRQSFIEHYGVDRDKVRRVFVGANVERNVEPLQPVAATNKTILFVGVDWERKGGPDLVAAFQRLPQRHRDARLVIVGFSPRINLANCDILGRLTPADVAQRYREAAIFCLPTKIEPFGIVFVEAMMHKVAVVAPRHGALVDFVHDKETGLLYDPGNSDELLDALTWLLDHPGERQAIAERGYAAVRDIYNWDVVGDRLRAEIIEVIEPEVVDQVAQSTALRA